MRNSESYIYRNGSSPNTRVALSSKNKILSKPWTSGAASFKQVGVLSTFDYSESRSIDPVRGVGFGDKIQELVPGVTEPMTLTLNRTLLYTASIAQEVGYRGGVDGLVRSLRQHKWPFDVRSELVFSEIFQDGHNLDDIVVQTTSSTFGRLALITRYEACWLNSISASFPSDSAIVMEDASATCTDALDELSTYGNGPDSYGDLLESGNSPFFNQGSGSALFG